MTGGSASFSRKTSNQQWVLRVFGVAGALLFGFFFALTFSTPQWVERIAADYIESRTNTAVHAGIDKLGSDLGGAFSGIAEGVYRQNEHRIDQIKLELENRVQEQWAAALAQVRNLSCECRQKILEALTLGSLLEMKTLQATNERLTAYIQGRYMDVVTDLKRDIRIFTATNAGVFILLLLVSLLKPQAVRHLFVPSILLCVATLVCAYGYVFEQNWLLTLINGSYLGFAYAAYLGVVFLFLCDIALNRGRVTTRLANGAIDLVGGTVASLTPC